MSEEFLYLLAALIVSAGLNILFISYISKMLKRMYYISDNLSYFKRHTNVFSEHLEKVYSMELFYGDQTLENLLKHAKELNAYYNEFMDSLDPEGVFEVENEILEDEEDNTEEKN